MLEDKKYYRNNSFSTIETIAGETIKAVLSIGNLHSQEGLTIKHSDEDSWLFVFNSGYSLQIFKERTFVINNIETTKALIADELDKHKGLVTSLHSVLSLLPNKTSGDGKVDSFIETIDKANS